MISFSKICAACNAKTILKVEETSRDTRFTNPSLGRSTQAEAFLVLDIRLIATETIVHDCLYLELILVTAPNTIPQ